MCYAIIESLALIFNLALNKYLIISDSISCLQSLNYNPFNSHISSLVLCIKSLIFCISQQNYIIHLLWVPSHIGIHGNKVDDNLAKSTLDLICPFFFLLPQSDFTPLLKC